MRFYHLLELAYGYGKKSTGPRGKEMKLRNILLSITAVCTASGLVAMDRDWLDRAIILHDDKYRVGAVYLTLGILALAYCVIDRCSLWYQRNQEQLEEERETDGTNNQDSAQKTTEDDGHQKA